MHGLAEKVGSIENPLEYSAQDERYGDEQLNEELEQYRERLRKVLHHHSGTPKEVINEVILLPDVFYRALKYACYGDKRSAKKVLERYVRKVSYELTRVVNDPDDMLKVYDVMEIGIGYMERTTGPIGIIAGSVIRPYFEKLIEEEEGRLKRKKKLEEIVKE
jgi:hypothetical protein